MTDIIPSVLRIIAPPPLLYLGAFALGVGMHLVAPIKLSLPATIHLFLGGLILLLSAALARWAFVTMHHWRTSANPRRAATALATNGPFRFSRNPIYVAMTGLYAGAALLVNSAWPLVALLPLLVVMQCGVIHREECYLEATFGAPYVEYKAQVRRWL